MFSTAEIWQYVGVFGALIAAGFGAPIPEELPIATGGVMVGRAWQNTGGVAVGGAVQVASGAPAPDAGEADAGEAESGGPKWWIMLPVCILGVVLCDTLLYAAGRKWGRWLIRKKWVQRRLLSPERFQKIEKNFHDYGIRILLIARLLPGIRTPVFLSAGICRLPFRKFLLADALYAIPGVNLIFWMAYWLTDTFMALLHRLESYRELAVIAVLSFFAGFLTATFVRRPVTTGSPEELPVLGKPVVTIANPPVPEVRVNDVPVMDGRAHPPSANGPPAAPDRKPEEAGPAPVSM